MSNNIFPFLVVPCKYCGKRHLIKAYHHSFNFDINEYYLTCPDCGNRMLMDIKITKENKEAEGNE